MQEYFRTAKTIVIDDQYNEAKPLLDALSKNQIPFFYTQGKPNSDFPLPNTDKKDAQYFNLVFLDLNLDFKFAGSQIGNDTEEKTFKGTHAQILNLVLRNRNRSFIIVVWSNEEETFLSHFMQLFDDDKYTLKRPYKVISLNKSNFFSLAQSGGYEFRKDERGSSKQYEDLLFQEIGDSLKDLQAFKLFCEWDKVVAQSVGDTTDDFMSLTNEILDDNLREEHLAKILTLISISYSGEQGFLNFRTDQEKTDSFMLALTQILNDDIDRNVLNERQNEFMDWKATSQDEIDNLYNEISPSLLNRKLLICYPNRFDLTGSIYKITSISQEFKRIVRDCVDHGSTVKALKIKYKKKTDDAKKRDAQSASFYEYIASLFISIELNVTPLCDIVQNKNINHRLLSGFMAEAKFYECIKKSDSFYKSHLFSYRNQSVFIGLDLRSFSSCSFDELRQKEYLFTLRTNLINDIQTKLAAHVSRIGVLNL
jgi:hypothetical protein